MTFIVCILLCVIHEKYKWDSQHNKLLKLRRTRYYINIRLLAQMLMLHDSTFLQVIFMHT
jgi:hypothetical protein